MTFLTLQQELESRLSAYDLSNSTQATKIKRWLNMAQQYICGKRLWPFMMTEEIVQTVVDYTTGTASVAAAGTTVTFSATIADSKTNQYIQFASSNDWYQITAHTAGASTATISPAATAVNTSAAYTIRKLLYTTSTPLIQILDMKQLVTPVRLISQSPREADFFLPLYYSAGTPYYYIVSSPNSSGSLQFSLMLSPDAALNIMVRGVKALTDMSDDADVSVIPTPWQDAIINIAAFYGFQGLDDTRAKSELELGELRINDMARVYTNDLSRHRVMQGVENDVNFGLQWALPSNFGPEAN